MKRTTKTTGSTTGLFDKIRISKTKEEEAARPAAQMCEHPDCKKAGPHRAPKGRGMEGKYFHFCAQHVREYNLSYNYFEGMPNEAVQSFQKSAQTGHRPTWTMGVRTAGEDRDHPLKAAMANSESPSDQRNPWAEGESPKHFQDPFGFFKGSAGAAPQPEQKAKRKSLGNAERKAFETLHLEISAKGPEIKMRYKEMVKRFHPDANGGDRSLEDKLREIIQAYSYLKSAGFC